MSDLESLLRASLNLNSKGLEQDGRGITLEEARKRLVRVGGAAARGELETAAREERDLFLRALRVCAVGGRDAQRIAAVAVLCTEFEYDRESGGL